MITNGIQLITYPNSLGGDLKGLRSFLDSHGKDCLSGVHILPFYPSSGDRGFAPLGYDKVDSAWGEWSDIEAMAAEYDVMADFMVNHLSRQSEQFLDFMEKKDKSPWSELFLRYKNIWPGGEAPQGDLDKIYTRKPRPPFVEVEFADGSREKIWCTFDLEQIDLDIRTGTCRRFIKDSLAELARHGVKMTRLDAFAYTTKRPGTNCFFVEPEVWEILDYCRGAAAKAGMEVLPEIHEHYSIQLSLAERDYWVYDFALPMLVLHTLYSCSAIRLAEWLRKCPRKQVTTLDTHDGIGVVDVVDLLSPQEIEDTKTALYTHGANVKPIYSSARYGNLDVYQINCSYYSALGESDNAYLIARAIQFFTPGVPQVYYVGMLAGRNDVELLERTRQGRDINRHDYTTEEIAREMQRPVVRKLFEMMEWRNRHPAFEGVLEVAATQSSVLDMRWSNGANTASLTVDLNAQTAEMTVSQPDGVHHRIRV